MTAFMKTGGTLGEVFVGFLLLAFIFILIERVLGRRRGQPWLRRGWVVNVIYWFFSPLVTGTLTKFFLIAPVLVLLWFGVATGDDFRLGQYRGFGPVARQPVWLQIIELYLMFDFIGYWTHRLFHRRRWWPFHAVHHSPEDLDWLSGVRLHPINELFSKLCQISPFLLLGFNPLVTLYVVPVFTYHAIFVHAAVDWDFGPLRGIIVSPVFHRWHHSKDRAAWNKNFSGLFAFWDRIFGTCYMPRDRLPENFGIPEEFPEGFLGQLGRPFVQFMPTGRKTIRAQDRRKRCPRPPIVASHPRPRRKQQNRA